MGYKTGVQQDKAIQVREFKWSFIGTPHLASRQDLLFQLSEVEPSFVHKTSKTGESKSLNVKEMNKILILIDNVFMKLKDFLEKQN